MSELVNLNKFRKVKARVDERTHAETNAVKFGLAKAEKNRQALMSKNAMRLLDGQKREDSE